jgi:phage/plasmid-associated DNA primase
MIASDAPDFYNSLILKTRKSYNDFTNYIKPYKNAPGVKDPNSNFIDQGEYKASYSVPHSAIPELFNLLEKCRLDNLPMSISEKQLEKSGIMLDFDIEQEDDKRQLTEPIIGMLRSIIIEVVRSVIGTSTYSMHCMCLIKDGIEFNKKKNCYKDGIHFIIPDVKVDKQVKKYIIKSIIEHKQYTFVDKEIIRKNEAFLDINSAHVVTLLPGNCKAGKKPYIIRDIYKYDTLNDFATTMYPLATTSFNISYDFSVNYQRQGSSVVKLDVDIKENVRSILSQVDDSEDIKLAEAKHENIMTSEYNRILQIVDILAPVRYNEYHYWFQIVSALAYHSASQGNETLKTIAEQFSAKRLSGIRDDFETVWENAYSGKYVYKYSLYMIHNYAKMDNPELYNIITNADIFNKLTTTISEHNGLLDHWHWASLLKDLCGNKFKLDEDISGKSSIWYEFISANDPHKHGELYKWKSINEPYNLRTCISTTLFLLGKNAVKHLDEMLAKAESESSLKYYSKLRGNAFKSIKKLHNNGFKNGVISECKTLFKEINFTYNLDRYDNMIGVGNGIVVFDKIPHLVDHYNDYYISRYTPTNYMKMDPKNPNIKAAFNAIWELFPPEEKDAFYYIMFFFSTSMVRTKKDCLFGNIIGNGANGKTFLVEIMRNILGNATETGYACKLPISMLIEKEQHSGNATPALMDLMYATFTYFSESEKSENLRVSVIKQLTSHEPISVRPLYGKQMNITHKSNFIAASNYTLNIRSTDHGTWRRLWYYMMKYKFDDHPNPNNKYEKKADRTLTSVKTNDPEFLSAMMSVMYMFLSIFTMKYNGELSRVRSPTIIRETEEFRNSQDTLNRFICDRVVKTVDPDVTVALADVVDAYCKWYDTMIKNNGPNGHDRADITTMLKNSRLMNFIDSKSQSGAFIKGHRLLGIGESKDHGEENLDMVIVTQKNTEIAVRNDNTSDQELELIYAEYMEEVKKHGLKIIE